MSDRTGDRTPPFDPFGRNDRTIVQPNPGGRRAQPATPTPAPAAPAAGAFGPQAEEDDWTRGRAAPPEPPRPAARPEPGQVMLLKRDVPVAPNDNMLLEAAGPLLLLLGRLRASLMQARFADLMDQVADAIDGFERQVLGHGVAAETASDAKYALAATADDIVQNIPSEDRPIWTQYSMLSRFFGERVGGVRFFEKLDKAKLDPLRNYDLLELMYTCLAIGFQGIHRTSGGGAATLQTIQRNLYETLRRVRPRTELDLSPHWRGQDLPPATAGFRVPLWSVAAVAAAVLGVTYITLRLLLAGSADTVAGELRRVVPDGPIALLRSRPVAPPPPPPASTQLDCIKAGLAAEIASGKLSVVESANAVILRVGAFASFASGQATVLDSFRPIAEKMGQILERQPGAIRVIGHSDATRIATARFPSNWHLSVERAQAVANLIRPALSQPQRIEVEGKGADQPLDSNDTNEGRARNRRVELMIPRDRATSCR
ncbi:type VI secretion system protein TssL, long form [Phreatobacter sp. AB_2022a]|uniref:type VI secretion system protein TssL, long form n=1 Tax=Phreatobacter sp. AB_2022a TaxID=3003134 RepID=UPI00228753E1|nr:type VI secretion system protein TssL, long form [Phreatobacter sp. AB_2022a]MCZ0738691.1 type VI secretion system protein TssL, long form [Phreatobacter sp. AB_2022a]